METVLAPETQPDIREVFAREMVSRSHRLQEVCSVLKIDPPRALVLLQDPLTQAHLTRLNTIGRPAEAPIDAMELAEVPLRIVRMMPHDFIRLAEQMPGKGQQSLDGFLSVQLKAVEFLKKSFFPSPEAMLRRARKVAKRTGEVFDQPRQLAKIKAFMSNVDIPEDPTP